MPKPAEVKPQPEVKQEAKGEPNPPAVAPQPGTTAPRAPSAEERLAVGEDYEKVITQLMDMGFPREQVVKAMKAAFNNPERATDYLINVRPN